MTSPEARFPESLAEKFEPRRLLASGGFGSVWLAQQKGLDRPVAIKTLQAEPGRSLDFRRALTAPYRFAACSSRLLRAVSSCSDARAASSAWRACLSSWASSAWLAASSPERRATSRSVPATWD